MSPKTLSVRGEPYTVREAAVDEIAPLRHRVLRQGLPFAEGYFKGDDFHSSRHAAAFDSNNDARCCATLHLEEWEGEPAWRLRGMATDKEHQSRGLGTAVLQYLTTLVEAEPRTPDGRPIRLFFCNARTPALDFYQRQGWQIVSDEFDIPTAGPHKKMIRRV
jgi:GNAT superfamily N-acetyltransferase